MDPVGPSEAIVAAAVDTVDKAAVCDNSRARPAFRIVAGLERGTVVGEADWPDWTPEARRVLGR